MGGSTDINYPAQPSYSESLRDSLTAQIDLAPELYAAEASRMYGRPAYAQLETDVLRETLLGGERFVPGATEGTAATMEDFDEAEYLRQYPDVLEKIESGEGARQGFTSAKQHYEQYGKQEIAEGRRGGPRALFNEQAYLEANPDVRRQLQSGEAAKHGYATAQEHYDKFGKGEIAAGGRADSTAQFMTGGSIFAPIEGAMQKQGGLLELLGGTGEQRFTGGISESPTQPGKAILGSEDRQVGYSPEGEFLGLAEYGSDIAEQAARRQRAADIADVGQYGQMATSALRAADPLAFGLLETMGKDAATELKAGGDLTTRERERAIQDARGGWEARGRVRDPGAVVSELENLETARRAREAQRRGFATQTMQASQAMTADPFMAILGRPSGASQQVATQGLSGAGYGLSAGPQMYSPESGISYQLGQSQNLANLEAARAAADATRTAGMWSGIGSAVGGIGGAYARKF